MEFRDGRAELFDFGEVADELLHQAVVAQVAGRDDVAEEDEEWGEGVVEDRPADRSQFCDLRLEI